MCYGNILRFHFGQRPTNRTFRLQIGTSAWRFLWVFDGTGGASGISINTSALVSGTYFIAIINKEQAISNISKIIINH